MKSKRRLVEAVLFARDDATVREIASGAGCTQQTARGHLDALYREEMVLIHRESGRGLRSWWVNVWYLTEKGREILGARKVLEEDLEGMYLRGVPLDPDSPARHYDPRLITRIVTTGSGATEPSHTCDLGPDVRLPYDVLPSMRGASEK